jgi:fumarate hydratase class II
MHHCARGIEPDRARIAEPAVALAYAGDCAEPAHRLRQRAARIAKRAHAQGCTLREAALALGYADGGEQFDAWVRPDQMV